MADEQDAGNWVVREVRTYHPDDHEWTARSVQVDDLTPRIRFLLNRTVYTGDPNNSAQFKSAAFNPAISLPTFPRQDALRPTSSEVLGHEEELADYYRRVTELTQPRRPEYNYWLRLSLESLSGSLEVGFPWWDRLADMSAFTTWLRTAPAGTGYLDQDQGWMIRAFRTEGRLHFLNSDPDDHDRERSNISVGRLGFLQRLDQAERDAREVIGRLKTRLAMDPWS
jgi:hypothetical protein